MVSFFMGKFSFHTYLLLVKESGDLDLHFIKLKFKFMVMYSFV